MPYTSNITPARVAGHFFFINAAARHAHPGLVAGPVSIQLPGGVILPGTFVPWGGPDPVAVVCYALFALHRAWPLLPLVNGDILEYEIVVPNTFVITGLVRGGAHLGGGPAAVPPTVAAAPFVLPKKTKPQATCGCEKNAEKDSCETLACQFIDYLRTRDHANVNLGIAGDWFSGAFNASAGAGNPAGSILKINQIGKDHIEIIVRSLLSGLTREEYCGQSRFDYLLRNAICQIQNAVAIQSPETSFTLGRSQKILNILLKYCYTWWLCNRTSSPTLGDVSWVDKWKPFMHVPVDARTIAHVHFCQEYADLRCGTWKWRMTEYEYLGIQDAVRKLAYSVNLDPICYEMRYIWIAGADV